MNFYAYPPYQYSANYKNTVLKISEKNFVNNINLPNLETPVKIEINGTIEEGIIDTGSNYTIIEERYIRGENLDLEKANIALTGAGGEDIDIIGSTKLEINIKNKQFQANFGLLKSY